MNTSTIVGRLVSDPILIEENGKKLVKATVAVNRSYKNSEGVYETDFIPVLLCNSIAENIAEYCKKGDLIGVRGRIENHGGDYNEDNGYGKRELVLVADKVTYLSRAS